MPLPSSITSDLDHVLGHAGVPVVYGAVRAFGKLRTEDVVVRAANGAELQERATVLRIRTGALGSVQVNADLSVNGVTYRVRDVSLDGDGHLERILLARVG